MSQRLDPDVKVLRAVVRALEQSSSAEMKTVNARWVCDRYLADLPEYKAAQRYALRSNIFEGSRFA